MTMIDDDRLASLLADAANTFDVPDDGRAAIIARARGAATGSPEAGSARDSTAGEDTGDGDARTDDAVGPVGRIRPLRRVAVVVRRNRLVTVAACVVALLVALAAVGALARPTSNRPTSALNAVHRPGKPTSASTSPTTTLPVPQPTTPAANAAPGATSSAQAQSRFGLSSPNAKSGNLPSVVGRSARVEQTGTLGLTVGHGAVSRTVAALATTAVANGGYVANSQTQTGAGGAPYGNVTLEVPVDSFAAVLKQAEALGRPAGVSTRATDVTGQYVDLQSRITALQSSRQQYLTIMAKATTIGDVLSVQEQIDAIQSQVEQLQGQLQVLTSETAYSSLAVTVNQSSPAPPPSPLPESGLIQAWHQSLGGFVDGFEGIVRLAGPTLFVLACLAGALLGGRALWRRARRHSL